MATVACLMSILIVVFELILYPYPLVKALFVKFVIVIVTHTNEHLHPLLPPLSPLLRMCDGHDKESSQLLINKIVKEMIASISKMLLILYKIILDKEGKHDQAP
jgi:hypothetical protein